MFDARNAANRFELLAIGLKLFLAVESSLVQPKLPLSVHGVRCTSGLRRLLLGHRNRHVIVVIDQERVVFGRHLLGSVVGLVLFFSREHLKRVLLF